MTQDIFFDSINRINEDPSLDHPHFDDLNPDSALGKKVLFLH